MTTLQKALDIDIRFPVIQAPMAGVQDSLLAIAVANAGGLGSLPCAMLGPEQIREELLAITQHTKHPFNVNFFCHEPPTIDPAKEAAWRALLAPYYAEFGLDIQSVTSGPGRAPFNEQLTEVLEEFKPAVVSFHFGLPNASLLAKVKSWGSRVLSTATTADEAIWLQAQGVDAIIAQGVEAGGHRGIFLGTDLAGQLSTFDLLEKIIGSVTVPVIAAGGIASAKTVAAAMAAGAAGVQVGTSYLRCPEATTSDLHRAALARATTTDTVLTNLFTGRPARAIRNRLIEELGAIREGLPDFPLTATAIAPLRSFAQKQGLDDFSSLWSGTDTSGCRPIPAAEITRELALPLSGNLQK